METESKGDATAVIYCLLRSAKNECAKTVFDAKEWRVERERVKVWWGKWRHYIYCCCWFSCLMEVQKFFSVYGCALLCLVDALCLNQCLSYPSILLNSYQVILAPSSHASSFNCNNILIVKCFISMECSCSWNQPVDLFFNLFFKTK